MNDTRRLAEHDSSHAQNRPVVALAFADTDIQERLRQYLCIDYDVVVVKDGDCLAAAVSSGGLDLLMFDKALQPRVDALRGIRCIASVPTIRLLGPAEGEDDEAVDSIEADGFVSFPISKRQLLTTVKSLVKLAGLAREAEYCRALENHILDSFSEAFFIVDAHWRITRMNSAAERTLRVQRDAVIGKNAWDALPNAASSPRAPAYQRAMAERIPVKLEGTTVDGACLEVSVIPSYNGGLAVYLRNATQLKKAQDAASAGERRLRLYLEHAKDYAFIILSLEGQIVEWLGGAQPLTGWSSEEQIGKPIESLMTPEDRTSGGYLKELATAERNGREDDKRWLVRKDGSRFFADGVTAAIRSEDGELQGFAKIFRDITSQKLAEEAVSQSREQLQLILDTAADGICGIAADGRCTFSNPAAAKMLGYAPGELTGHSIQDLLFHPLAEASLDGEEVSPSGKEASPFGRNDSDIVLAIRDRVKRETTDEMYWRKDGTPFPVHQSVNPIIDGDGKTTGAVIAFSDVTTAKRAEAALRDSERKLRFVMDSMPQKIFSAAPEGNVDYLNPSWTSSTGIPVEQLRDWGWTQLIHPDDLERTTQAWLHSIKSKEAFRCQYRSRDNDGGFRWHLAQAQPLRDEAGQVIMWVGSHTDIHHLKAAEAQLTKELADEKRAAARLADVAAASRALNSDLSVGNVIHILAEKTQSILGVQYAEVMLAGDERRGEAASIIGRSGLGYDTGSNKGDAVQPQDRLHVPIIGHGEKNIGVIRVYRKIEGEFNKEDEAVLAQLAAIAAVSIENSGLYETLREQDQRKDEFLATLAHELRNPLAPLRTGLDLLKLSEGEQQAGRIRGMMERQLVHMVRLVDDLMDVSRVSRGKIELKRERVSLRTVVDTAIEASRPLINSSQHRLRVFLPKESLQIFGDPTRLAQVLSNLLNNAAKYTPTGGEIELAAERQGGEVIIRVIDTGAGIPQEMLAKIFELFTQVSPGTDRSTGGVGIGLALVKNLVELHGGNAWAESAGPGSGSTFNVRLPLLSRSSAEVDSASADGGSLKSTQRRILVVDDNVEAAETLCMLLEFSGHEVVTAHSGNEALRTADGFVPDIAFLDIGLPGMSGYDLATSLRRDQRLRNTALIALTGWGGEDDRRRAKEAGFDLHLTKPIDAKTLSEALERFSPKEAAT